eukprot:s1772_g6.t1
MLACSTIKCHFGRALRCARSSQKHQHYTFQLSFKFNFRNCLLSCAVVVLWQRSWERAPGADGLPLGNGGSCKPIVNVLSIWPSLK